MDFWNTEESAVWNSDSVTDSLHDSLFGKTNESKAKKNRKRKKKPSSGATQRKSNHEQQEDTKLHLHDEKNSARKRKLEEVVGHANDSSSKQTSVYVKKVKKGKKDKKYVSHSQDGKHGNTEKSMTSSKMLEDNLYENVKIDNISSPVLDSTTITDCGKKKQKKNGRKNKLTKSNEREESKPDGKHSICSTIDSLDDKHVNQPTRTMLRSEVQCEDDTRRTTLTRKERRKLKRKIAKELANDKTCERTSDATDKSADDITTNGDVTISKSEVPSHEDTSKTTLTRKERRKLKRKMNKKLSLDKTCEMTSDATDKSAGNIAATISDEKETDTSETNLEKEENVENERADDLITVNPKRARNKSNVSLKDQMESQLKSAQFRFLNEHLYKITGKEAKRMFAGDKEAFHLYHEGYTQQVGQWPANPVDIVIEGLKKRPPSSVVGDFGCGDAKIARSVQQKVHSFDLHPLNEHVTVCDIAKVPLKTGELDIAVFCLSLMGTNWTEYILEANRVLKQGGLLKIAEVASRFKSLQMFFAVMKKLGFHLVSKNVSNKMFYLFDFKKKHVVSSVPEAKGTILKPCLYKRR